MKKIDYKEIVKPIADCSNIPVMLSEKTMQERYKKVLLRMEEENLDTLVIYGDLEHGNNFEYLTGFLPRFEEALLIVHRKNENFMIMGNENLNKVALSRIEAKAIHAPHFSLPNQPMGNNDSMHTILCKAQICEGLKVGIVGWKNFKSINENNAQLFDVPTYIVDELRTIVRNTGSIINATYLFVGEHGVRCNNNVNEIEHYEFGAALASDCVLKAMNHLELGISEMELGNDLNAYGQKNSVVTIASAGKRFINANLYPTNNTVKLGDNISLTIGYKGGLSSRVGYAVHNASELAEGSQDYIDVLVKPYYYAVVTWLEKVHCGCIGNNVYELIEDVLPKSKFHWELCPGHLTADEEWLSSPIYDGSNEVIKSGMLFQIDIIPSMSGYAGVSCECTVALADENLRDELAQQAPELWKRIIRRREYIINELHIELHPDILPMSSTVAYLRPYLLNKEMAMAVA